MKILINYSDRIYKKAQIKNCQTGFDPGGFDMVIKYGLKDVDKNFYLKNKHIFDLERGAGYWLWKPYIIKKTMSEIMNEDDILFYCDAGHYFHNSIDYMIPLMEATSQKILCTSCKSQITKKWTKRDAFFYMDCDEPKYHNAFQKQSGFLLLKKNNFTTFFIDEWLKYSQDYRILTDSPNECGLNNYEEFIDHRHDQSIFSLLAEKYSIKSILPPEQYFFNNPEKEIPLQIIVYSGRHNTE